VYPGGFVHCAKETMQAPQRRGHVTSSTNCLGAKDADRWSAQPQENASLDITAVNRGTLATRSPRLSRWFSAAKPDGLGGLILRPRESPKDSSGILPGLAPRFRPPDPALLGLAWHSCIDPYQERTAEIRRSSPAHHDVYFF